MNIKHEYLKEQIPAHSHWSEAEFFSEILVLDNLDFHMVGFSSTNQETNVSVTGSAAACFPFDENLTARAYFELIERMAICDHIAPSVNSHLDYQYSKSNGVAFHLDYELAKESAKRELIERDAILRYWFANKAPLRVYEIPTPIEGVTNKLRRLYDFKFFVFESPLGSACNTFVTASFAFPKTKEAHFCYGLGSASSLSQSLEKSFIENIQTLSFLWGESFEKETAFSPTPSYHQSCFMTPWGQEKIKNWLSSAGNNHNFFNSKVVPSFTFSNITPLHLNNRAFIIKAQESNALPLIFGKNYPLGEYVIEPERFIHPIC